MRTQTMVQLTENLVRRLDALADRRGVSRSKLIRDAVQSLLDAEERDERVRRFVATYTEVPETDEELASAMKAARALVADEPW